MKKVRIFELSRDLGVSNKEIIELLKDKMGIEVKSHSSTIDADVMDKVISMIGKKGAATPLAATPPPPPPAPAAPPPPMAAAAPASSTVTASIPARTEKRSIPPAPQRPASASPGAHRPAGPPHAGASRPPGQAGAPPSGDKSSPLKRKKKRRGPRPETNENPVPEALRMGETATIRDIIKGVDKPKLITRTFPWPKDSGRGGRRSRQGRAPAHVPEATKKESVQKWVEISEFVTVGELAAKLEIPANEIIKFLMKLGIIAGINQNLSFENSASVAKNFGYKVEKEKQAEVKPEEEEDEENLLSPRPPVVTVLGHVDHGKTSLLDAIRNTNVTASESGGITQNIGASTIDLDNRKIVFIDTPGHEAFTAMRARGAQVTDIAVLVVAADDGVMPQTIEAISHAKAAKVPIIVAINKIDKAEANPEKVKQQLTEFDFLPEDWGGSTVMVPVSAKTKAGINDMLEMILLVADMEELKANPHRKAQGIIIESKLDKGVGPVATVIVQNGTLKVGDAVVVGNEWGRIRIMINDKGKKTRKALPSYPVEIVGLSGVPAAGDLLQVVDDEKVAKTISEGLKLQQRSDRMSVSNRISLEDLFEQMKRGETKELNLIIKADVNGALEALKNSIVRLSNQEVRINVIYGGIGTITESDVMLATASNAIIIGFNVRPDPITRRLAEQEKVDVRLYRVIYHAIQDIKAAMVGLLEPEYEEALLGRAEVRAIFKISKVGVVAGLYVIEGKLVRNAKIRVLRDHVVIYEGKIDSLRRFKDDVREIATGFEGGIFIEKFPAFQSGDIIEAYTLQEIKRDSIEIDGTMVSIKKD